MKVLSCILATFIVPALAAAVFAATPAPGEEVSPASEDKGWTVLPDEPEGGGAAVTGAGLMARGEESYEAGDYEKALDDFKAALPLLGSDAERARAHSRIAFIYAAFDKMDEAYAEFVEALKLDPGIEMDPNQVSPKIYESFKRARGEVVREGTLVCGCDPAGAEVYLDGVLLGEAPVKKERIPEGEYTLTLRKPGYETSVGSITIKKDVTLTVEDKLAEARGELFVDSEPQGATVVFDGKTEGVTPLTVRRVNGGDHEVVLKRDYFDGHQAAIRFEKAEKKEMRIALKRRLLVVGIVEGEEDGDELSPALEGLLMGPFSSMEGLRVITSGMKPLAQGLTERGLDPASLSFLRQGRQRLELEDAAAFSGIMEKAGVELALVARLSQPGRDMALTLMLYSAASDIGDKAVFVSPDVDGFGKHLYGYAANWTEQEKARRTAIGARLADRASGGVEVLSVLPGFPAASAGLMPGDIITSAGGKEVKEKKDLLALLRPGEYKDIGFTGRGRKQTAKISAVEAPLETPVGSGDYLYNLALVGFDGAGEEAPGSGAGKPDGLLSLNLGNVYFRLGEYRKAVDAYLGADPGTKAGICAGTALYRLGEAYMKLGLWSEAAGAYRKALMLYPDATLEGADGPYVAPLARQRLKEMFVLGLVRERWWL